MEDWWTTVPEVMESMMDAFWGSSDSRSNADKRQEIGRKTYVQMLTLWNALSDATNLQGGKRIPTDEHSPVARALGQFHEEMRTVFQEFETNESYAKLGLLEKWSHYMGKQVHRNMAASDNLSKEIQYEMEKFWDDFFALIRREEAEEEVPTLDAFTAQTITGLTADRLRKGFEDALLREGQTAGAKYQTSARGMLGRYEELVGRKIGIQLADSDKLTVAQGVTDRISVQVMERLNAKLNLLLTGNDLLEVSDELAALIRVNFFYEFRWAMDNLILYDTEYRTLMRLPALTSYSDVSDIVILRVFGTDADRFDLTKKIEQALDPAKESWERRNVLASVATRTSGAPLWAIETDNFRWHAASVFVKRTLFRVNMYHMLSRQLQRDKVDLNALAMGKLKEIIHLKTALHLQESFKSWAVSRIMDNLEFQVADDVSEICYYAAAYITKDISNELYYHFRQFLSNEFLNGVQYFADCEDRFRQDSGPKLLLQQMRKVVDEWWPWGTMDGEEFTPANVPAEEKLHIYNAEMKANAAKDKASGKDKDSGKDKASENDNASAKENAAKEIAQAVNPVKLGIDDLIARLNALKGQMEVAEESLAYTDHNAVRILDRRVFERLGVSRADLFAEVGRAAAYQMAINKANQWVDHYQQASIKDFVKLAPYEVMASEEQKQAYAQNMVQFAAVNVQETIARGYERTVSARDFRSAQADAEFKDGLPDSVLNYFYYLNIATNLEFTFHRVSALKTEFFENLEGQLAKDIQQLLEAELPNEIQKVCPDFKPAERFNAGIEYNVNTFPGVMAKFIRNVVDVINRRNMTEAS